MNTVDPRVARTRQMLQNALLELMVEKPFQSISVSGITKRATLNRATFYLHYVDKFDLLAKTARETFIATIEAKRLNWETFLVEDIKILAYATGEYLDGFLRDCSPANKPYEPMVQAEIQQVLYDYIYCWLSSLAGNPKHTLSIETVAMVVSSSILNMCLKWSRRATDYALSEVVDEVYKVLTEGILQTVPTAK